MKGGHRMCILKQREKNKSLYLWFADVRHDIGASSAPQEALGENENLER